MSSKENHKTTVIEENSIKTDKPARKKNSDRNNKTTGTKKRAGTDKAPARYYCWNSKGQNAVCEPPLPR